MYIFVWGGCVGKHCMYFHANQGRHSNWLLLTTSYALHTVSPDILYAARRDCRATPRAQMMISARPPPYLEKRKFVSNTNNSTVESCLHADTWRIIELYWIIAGAHVRACRPSGAVQYTNRLYLSPKRLVHDPLGLEKEKEWGKLEKG